MTCMCSPPQCLHRNEDIVPDAPNLQLYECNDETAGSEAGRSGHYDTQGSAETSSLCLDSYTILISSIYVNSEIFKMEGSQLL